MKRLLFLPVLLLLGGCLASAPAPAGPPSAELAAQAVAATAPDSSTRIRFAWELRERDARFTGLGAARVAPGYRARLDLFGPRGEGYLSAVAIEGEVRLPTGVGEAPLPPPPLLWSALGVLRPPEDAELVGSTLVARTVRLEYARGPQRWHFEIEDGRVRRASLEGGGLKQTVELEGVSALGLPARVLYRDWTEFRELVLSIEEAEHVEPFPPATWTLREP